MILSNLLNICLRAENTQKLVRRACKDCAYFNNSDYLTCAIHPMTAPHKTDVEAWRTSNCKDWEPKK